jgi:diguanylate cyclase (GGDEF)-like protein/PAS domain S-box-containing protein
MTGIQALTPESETRRRELRRRVKFTASALLFSLLALICAAYLLARHSQLVRQVSAQQNGLTGWAQQLQSIDGSLTDAESAQRSYLLTGHDSYLASYHAAVQRLPAQLAKLNALPFTDPTIIEHIHDINQLAATKLAELAEALEIYDQAGREASAAFVKAANSELSMQRLHSDIGDIDEALRAHRRRNSAAVSSGIAEIQNLAIITVAALLISVLLVGYQIKLLLAAHRRYEDALATSERRHRAIVEDQTELIALSRADGSLRYVNPAYARFFQIAPETLGTIKFYDFVVADDGDALRSQLTVMLSNPQAQPILQEVRVVGSGAVARWVEWRHRVQRDTDGQRVIYSVGRDVTGPRQAAMELRASKDFLARIGRVAGIGGWQLDMRSQTLHCSEEMRNIYEVSGDYLPSLEEARTFYSDEHRAVVGRAVAEGISNHKPWDVELPFTTATGRQIYVRHVGEAEYDETGAPIRLVGALQDISERQTLIDKERAVREELARETATLNSVIEAIPAMVAVWDTDLRYRLVNKAFERWRGRPREELIGRTLDEITGDTEYPRSLQWVERVLAGETVSFERDYPSAQESRHVSITYLPLRLKDGQVAGFVEVAQDITMHREENFRLLHMSERDALTGLLNRIGLEKYLSTSTSQGNGASLALLYIDLDHFKPINDAHGHPAGDEVLRAFGTRLQQIVRPSDAVARLGGDEFAIVLAGIRQPADAVAVADKVVAVAREPVVTGELVLTIGASVGVAFDADLEGGWKGLIARADTLVYRAKANGRGRRELAPTDEAQLLLRRSHRPS